MISLIMDAFKHSQFYSRCFNKYFFFASELKQSPEHDNSGHQDSLINPLSNSKHLRLVNAIEVHGLINKFKDRSTRDSKISSLKVANFS